MISFVTLVPYPPPHLQYEVPDWGKYCVIELQDMEWMIPLGMALPYDSGVRLDRGSLVWPPHYGATSLKLLLRVASVELVFPGNRTIIHCEEPKAWTSLLSPPTTSRGPLRIGSS